LQKRPMQAPPAGGTTTPAACIPLAAVPATHVKVSAASLAGAAPGGADLPAFRTANGTRTTMRAALFMAVLFFEGVAGRCHSLTF
jgi:hypothetical protein